MMDRVEVQALFCDEVRVEKDGKVSVMGLYTAGLVLPDPLDSPADRLGIVISARWPREFRPDKIGVRLQLPRQELLQADLPETLVTQAQNGIPVEAGAFRHFSSFNIRTSPLQPGDIIEAWLMVNGHALTAGQLQVQGVPASKGRAVP